MSVSLARTTLALSGALALAGTLAAVPAGAAPATGAAPARSVAGKAPSPCLATGCKVVARVDVDGDGRADTVSSTPTRANGAAAWTLRVVTARKAVAQVTYGTPYLYEGPSWFGAARMDGVVGHELVVRTGWGAHTQYFGVYSWRGGKLVAQRAPGTRSREWFTDGAYWISQGYTGGLSKGRKTLTTRTYLRGEGASRKYFTGTATTYTWRAGAWRKTGSSTVRVHETSPKVAAAYGWRVAGLPRD